MSKTNGGLPGWVRFLIKRGRWSLIGLLVCIVIVIVYLSTHAAPRPTKLTITGGNPAGLRHSFAEMLSDEAAGIGLKLDVQGANGSVDALRQVASGEIDMALVQGGLGADPSLKLRQLTALHVEPLHLAVRKQLHAAASRSLLALRGQRVNISTKGSGTRRLALVVLQFAGVLNGNERMEDATTVASTQPTANDAAAEVTTLSGLSYPQLLAINDPAQLPDAVFAVSSLPSPVIKHLIEHYGYKLVPLPFGEAFAIDGVSDRSASAVSVLATDGVSIDQRDVEGTNIPAMMYDRAPPTPPQPLRTLGVRLLLVCREDLDPAQAERMLDVVFHTRFSRSSVEPITPKLLELPPQFPLHEGALNYKRRDLPLLTGETLDMIERALNLGAPLVGGVFFLITWLASQRHRRREIAVRKYVQRVNEIEKKCLELEKAPDTPIYRLVILQRDLTEMKTEAMASFSRGDLQGQVLSSFLQLVADTRNYITRLIAQERESQVRGEASKL